MLSVSEVSFSYSNLGLIQGVSFDVKTNEIVSIVGKSGEGKSTLLKLIAGLIDVEAGRILLYEEPILGPAFNLVPGYLDIQLVNQDFALDIYHSVEQNIRQKCLYLPYQERDELVHELLNLVELNHLKEQQAYLLSGGEQQRLAIARALACEPKMLLLDEPFVHIDQQLKTKIVDYLLRIKEERSMSVLLVSHDGAEVLSFSDRIIFFEKGKIRRIDTPESFYYAPQSRYEGLFFGWINEVKLEGERILFRPNEFEIVPSESEGIELLFLQSKFFGSFFVSEFITLNEEKIQLIAQKSLKDVRKINIKKRN